MGLFGGFAVLSGASIKAGSLSLHLETSDELRCSGKDYSATPESGREQWMAWLLMS